MSPLSILFQDEWLVAINKPAGYLVHASDRPRPDDKVAMKILRDQLGRNIHVVHRLDQPTSGVVLFSTDKFAAKKLRQAFEKRRVQKTYLAVVHGHPSKTQWECFLPLCRSGEDLPKTALTSFEVLQPLPRDLALLQATPLTGRFHQIRRHLLHDGHPIVGDFRYLDEEACHAMGESLGIGTRMLLQAQSLSFNHPVTGEGVFIEAPIDPAIASVMT